MPVRISLPAVPHKVKVKMKLWQLVTAHLHILLEYPEVFEVAPDKKINLKNQIQKPDPKVSFAFQMQQHKVL